MAGNHESLAPSEEYLRSWRNRFAKDTNTSSETIREEVIRLALMEIEIGALVGAYLDIHDQPDHEWVHLPLDKEKGYFVGRDQYGGKYFNAYNKMVGGVGKGGVDFTILGRPAPMNQKLGINTNFVLSVHVYTDESTMNQATTLIGSNGTRFKGLLEKPRSSWMSQEQSDRWTQDFIELRKENFGTVYLIDILGNIAKLAYFPDPHLSRKNHLPTIRSKRPNLLTASDDSPFALVPSAMTMGDFELVGFSLQSTRHILKKSLGLESPEPR